MYIYVCIYSGAYWIAYCVKVTTPRTTSLPTLRQRSRRTNGLRLATSIPLATSQTIRPPNHPLLAVIDIYPHITEDGFLCCRQVRCSLARGRSSNSYWNITPGTTFRGETAVVHSFGIRAQAAGDSEHHVCCMLLHYATELALDWLAE